MPNADEPSRLYIPSSAKRFLAGNRRSRAAGAPEHEATLAEQVLELAAEVTVAAQMAYKADMRAKRNERLLHSLMEAVIAQGIDAEFLTACCAKRGIKFVVGDTSPAPEEDDEQPAAT